MAREARSSATPCEYHLHQILPLTYLSPNLFSSFPLQGCRGEEGREEEKEEEEEEEEDELDHAGS
jgi:hypothetical protein